jgi:hypothetical protein
LLAYLTIARERPLVAALVLALGAVGCGGSSGGGKGGAGGAAGAGGGAAPLCIPGASVSCACTNGATGAQVCNALGSGYGLCSCTSTGAGGGGGSGAVTGAGGTTGAGGGAGAGGSAGAGGGAGGTAGSGGGAAGAGAGGAGGAGQGITPFTGSFTCADFSSSGACVPFDTGTEGAFSNAAAGSTAIAYPLDHSLFPSNLGPTQFQMKTAGTAARISFQTLQTNNVKADFYGACEVPGAGCSVTIPLAFTQKLIPASATEDIQITARVLSGTTPTNDSSSISAAWSSAGLSGGLYYWTAIVNQPYCPNAIAGNPLPDPGSYCLLDTALNPKNGTAIYRYDFSQPTPAPQQVWTDDGGPDSSPSYQGGPQPWNGGQVGGHCIGCHSISNDGKFMALGIGGSSTYNAANWALLDIQNQDLLLINPLRTGGNGCTDSNASPLSDPNCYWQSYRKDAFAIETAWGPTGAAAVAMYKSQLYLNTVAPSGTVAVIAQSGPALPTSAALIDPYQSDPFWSHDGSLLVYTSFSQLPAANTTSNPGGLNGDLKTGGQIAIANATPTSITDNAHVLVARQNNKTSYYPCVSEDSQWIVYDQSDCGGNPSATDISYNGSAGYGNGVCDGYDDSTAKLYLASADGNTMLSLDNANGGSASYDNSWPRFSPAVGLFRGQALYWVVFSSRRPYGVQNNAAIAASQPQLWFAALTLGEINAGDPSWSAVWLPGQNPGGNGSAYGNHTPQWVKVPITIDVP